VPSTPISASGVIATNAKMLTGWALAETSGTASAAVYIYDGSNASGSLLAPVNLAAFESTRDILPAPGLPITSGQLYVQVVSGTIQGAVWWA
jgi:hypothetical protein